MSEEQTNVAQETATENQTQETNTEVKVETPKQNTFTQEQLDNIIKEEVKYTDDGRIEIVDNHSNVRYNAKGELFTLEDRVNEFLDSNPHFRKGSLSGSGSQSAVGGKTVKPLNIQDLDMSKPEDRKVYDEYRKKRDQGAIEINLTK
jgi:hypothetical protein